VWTFTFQRRIRRSFRDLVSIAGRDRARNPLNDPLMRQKLVQSYIEVEILRLIGYRSLTRLLKTGHPGVESSIEKIAGSETDQRLQEVAMELLGAYGIADHGALHEAPAIVRDYLYSRSETIMGGTSEIQRNLIAQRILGLPR
jgi:alkylation response protein AidB-like acyl-CoA dehydrogenase